MYNRIRIIAFIAVVIMVVVAGCSGQSSAERDFQNLVSKVEKINVDMNKKQSGLMETIRKFNQKYPQMQIDTLAQSAYGLTPEEAKILGERISKEQDISTKGLLSEIVNLGKQVEEMKAQMDEMAKQLPPPHVVQRGESHFQICLDYLTNEAGFSRDSAMKALERVAQFDEMMPGFYVWHFIDKKSGSYLTTVTQGEAKISPNQLRRATKRKIEQERQALVQAKADLEAQVADLEKRKAALLGQIESIGTERDQARQETKVVSAEKTALAAEKDQLTVKLNTVYYTIGNMKDLKKQGVLKSPLLGKVKSSDLTKLQYDRTLDLSKSKSVMISANSVSLKSIKEVVIYPEAMYKAGSDYKVTLEGGNATVQLLNADRFKGANVVIAVK